MPIPIEMSLASQLGGLYPLIEQHRMTLREELNNFRNEDIEYAIDDPATPTPFSATDVETRADIICDILSSFDVITTPSQFRHRFADHIAPESSSGVNVILVQESLQATMYRLALRDDEFYRCLQQIVPREIRAIQYYKTEYKRAQDALQMLSQYAETGPTVHQIPENDADVNVPACARYIRSIVNELCQDRDRRNSVTPLPAPLLRRFAEILTKLIGRVVAGDRDIYDRPQWNAVRPLNEPLRDRNLFVYLIGDPPSDPGLPGWMTDHFVIDRLRNFPSSEWSHLLELFTTIKDTIEEKDMDALPGAYAYVAKIDNMIHEYTATADEPSSSSAQVPRRS